MKIKSKRIGLFRITDVNDLLEILFLSLKSCIADLHRFDAIISTLLKTHEVKRSVIRL